MIWAIWGRSQNFQKRWCNCGR